MASLHFAFLWFYSIPLMIWIRMLSLAHIYQDNSLLFSPHQFPHGLDSGRVSSSRLEGS